MQVLIQGIITLQYTPMKMSRIISAIVSVARWWLLKYYIVIIVCALEQKCTIRSVLY